MDKGKQKIVLFIVLLVIVGLGIGFYQYNKSQNNDKSVANDNISKSQSIKTDNTKVETPKKEEEPKKEEQKKETTNNIDSPKVESKTQTSKLDEKITQDKAVEIVGKYVSSKNQKAKSMFDHIQKRDGIDYYVIRAYEDMTDHISTLAWYYVDVKTGKAFEWDLVEDKLIPLK